MTRRQILMSSAALAAGQSGLRAQQPAAGRQPSAAPEVLPMEQWEPKSVLKVPETHVARARYPVIDFHTHMTHGSRQALGTEITVSIPPDEALPVMERKNIRTLVNLTGSYGAALKQAVAKIQEPHPGKFVVFTEPAYDKASDPGYPKTQADLIEQAHRDGAKGLKVLKTLGLFLQEKGSKTFVRPDDRRFDPMWEATAALNWPVAWHCSEPIAFFLPCDRFNERWEEMHTHPESNFYEKGTLSDRELQEARRTVMRRHPKLKVSALHVGVSEDLGYVSECLDAHPNMTVDIAARIGELGRQPRMARKFFDKYQDRILFGTDASEGAGSPQQMFGDAMYEIYYRFLETEDEYFNYCPWPHPVQGRWFIYGIGLPDGILKKVYQDNAGRLLGLSA